MAAIRSDDGWHRVGFTLVELLVVVAIIALLLSILLPSLGAAREQAKKVRCLANMKDLGAASHTYAASDSQNILVPTPHRKTSAGLGTAAAWFLGNAHFGGRGGNPSLIPDVNLARVFNAAGQLGPKERPLNRVIFKKQSWQSYEEAKADGNPYTATDPRLMDHARIDMPIYHCPSDFGIPQGRGAIAPEWGAFFVTVQVPGDVPLYDVVGNSYTTHWATPLITTTGGYPYWGYGALGRQDSAFPNAARNIIYREGVARAAEYYNRDTCCGQTAALNKVLRVPGWHGRDMEFNATFADGHAESISHLVRDDYPDFPNADWTTLKHTGIWKIRGSRPEPIPLPHDISNADEPALIRGDGWAMDCFPAPMNVAISSPDELAPPFP